MRTVLSRTASVSEVCRRNRPDWMKFHCYMNNGKDRQTMMMCMERCHHDYEQKRYDLFGKPTGIIAISARGRVEDLDNDYTWEDACSRWISSTMLLP